MEPFSVTMVYLVHSAAQVRQNASQMQVIKATLIEGGAP